MAYVRNPCLFGFWGTFILRTIKTGTLSNFHMTSLADESKRKFAIPLDRTVLNVIASFNLYIQKSK